MVVQILIRVEEEIDKDFLTKTEERVYGYMSELLLNVWCMKKN